MTPEYLCPCTDCPCQRIVYSPWAECLECLQGRHWPPEEPPEGQTELVLA